MTAIRHKVSLRRLGNPRDHVRERVAWKVGRETDGVGVGDGESRYADVMKAECMAWRYVWKGEQRRAYVICTVV